MSARLPDRSHLATLVVVALLVLAGCSAFAPGDNPTPTTEPVPTTTTATGSTPTTTADPSSPSTSTTTATPASTTTTAAPADFSFDDPPTDRLGWEAGVWHNETLDIDRSDGLDESELTLLVSRSMARVELVRELEFREPVDVSLQTRSEFQTGVENRTYTEAFRRFDNAKFEAMFFIGEGQDALDVQNQNRGSNVLGFYSSSEDAIVIISDDASPDAIGEGTLSHELVHALQDQYWDLGSFVRPTREVYNAQNGLIEGDANVVQRRYMDRCGGEWDCVQVSSSSGGGAPANWGVYFLNFFPYSDGPSYIASLYDAGGWEAVNAAYDAPPASTEQVIYPELYGQEPPVDVTLDDRTANGWSRVTPDPPSANPRPDYAVLGQSALSSMFAYTLADEYNRTTLVSSNAFLNRQDGEIDSEDPFNYDFPFTQGWAGDRLHVYEKDDETAYVWKLQWDSAEDAQEFRAAYVALLSHWGGARVEGPVYRIDEGPFADAFRVTVSGETVTIVNAPSVDDLDDVYDDG